MTCTEIAGLLPAAAIGALDPDEARLVADHVATCAACHLELERLGPLTTSLAFTAPSVEPPARLRANILATARAEARPVPAQPAFRFRLPRLWPAFGRLGLAGTALGLILALGSGVWAHTLWTELESQRKINQTLAEGLQGQDDLVQLISSRAELLSYLTGTESLPRARGRVYASTNHSMALVVVDNLPQLPPDRVYQVWLIQAGEPNSAGTFVIDADGRARWVIHSPEPLSRYQAITITEEPVDGSLRPTTPTLLTGIF